MDTKKWSNCGYVGHIPQLVVDNHGYPKVLIMSPRINILEIERYDELLDEMMLEMTDCADDWCYIFDTHLIENLKEVLE